MKNAVKVLLICLAICCIIFLVIHRRVIKACITGEPMPEPPAWHKKYFKCLYIWDKETAE